MNVGLGASISGLLTAQRALDVASHNLANSSTEGYSRQTADIETASPQGKGGFNSRYAGPGQVGTGVSVQQITRVRDQFIDRQLRAESSPLGQAKVASDTLGQVQAVLNEPAGNSLGTQLDKFWNAWQSLSAAPENSAYRVDLRERATTLAGTFQDISTKFTALRQDLNDRIGTTVSDINSSIASVADLNRQITTAIAEGQHPNDLQDKRDLALSKLSEKLAINVVEVPSTGAQNVFLGGQPLVLGQTSIPLQAQPILTSGYFQVNYQPPTAPGALPQPPVPASITGGELYGLLDARYNVLSDTTPPGFLAQVNALATNLASAVNTLHSTGYGLDGDTTQNFFQSSSAGPITAATITVNPLFSQVAQNLPPAPPIKDGIRYIAAATNDPGSLTGGRGDNGNAVAIAQLRNASQAALGNITFDSYYKNVVTLAGTMGQDATRKETTQTQLIASVKDRQAQVSGVSSDEELANVLKFQKAYAASAKVLATIDQMLDTLINSIR